MNAKFLILAALATVALVGTANAGEGYAKWRTDSNGIEAQKSGSLIPTKAHDGVCGPGFQLVHGTPGDATCFWLNSGTLRCPNKCVLASESTVPAPQQ